GVAQLLAHVAAGRACGPGLDLSGRAAAAVGVVAALGRVATRGLGALAAAHSIGPLRPVLAGVEAELAGELDRVLELLEIAELGDPRPRGGALLGLDAVAVLVGLGPGAGELGRVVVEVVDQARGDDPSPEPSRRTQAVLDRGDQHPPTDGLVLVDREAVDLEQLGEVALVRRGLEVLERDPGLARR